MVNQVILEGIRQAVSKGYTLQQAMMSFFNSGYPREEIQEAARQFQIEQIQRPQLSSPQTITTQPITQRPVQPIQKPQPVVSYPQTNQAISGYPPQQKSSGKGLIIMLIVLLVILLGVLGAAIFFKEQIINFFNGV